MTRSLRSTVPLAGIAIFLAELLLDKTEPRTASPWWWLALIALLAGLLLSLAVRARASNRGLKKRTGSSGLVRGSTDVRKPRE